MFRRKTVFLRVFTILFLGLLLFGPTSQILAQARAIADHGGLPLEELLPVDQRYRWTVKFTCVPEAGDWVKTSETPGPFVYGTDHRTVVNIHNFRNADIRIWKRAELARSQRHNAGPQSNQVTEVMKKGNALAVDCKDIVNLFPKNKQPGLNTGDGFFILESRAWLDVQVFYSSITTLWYDTDFEVSSGIDMEVMTPRIIHLPTAQ